MALRDPAEKNLLRMEARRFASRCDAQIATIERADNLREIARLVGSIHLTYPLSEEASARDALRLVQVRAEDRARELIVQQLKNYQNVEAYLRDAWRRTLLESWRNLTGPLAHLHPWAMSRLAIIEQQLQN